MSLIKIVESVERPVESLERPMKEISSKIISFTMENDHVTFMLPSTRLISIPFDELKNNSMYFSAFFSLQKSQNIFLVRHEKIDINEIGWCNIQEDILALFLLWIWASSSSPYLISPVLSFYYLILGNYFQASQQKEEEIITHLKAFPLLTSIDTIQPYWSYKYLKFQFFEAILLSPISVKSNILEFALEWMDEDSIEDTRKLPSTKEFKVCECKEFLRSNIGTVVPLNPSSLLTILSKFKVAHRAIDAITVLESVYP